MKKDVRQFRGVTLVELLVALGVIASLVAISLPARRLLKSSFETSGTKSMISAALATARAIAAKEQHYAGVRFQQDVNGLQYIIFIMHDSDNLTANGFRAVEGLKPLKLPETMGVMDLTTVDRTGFPGNVNDIQIQSNGEINELREVTDTTTFSIVFSPSGKLVTCEVRVRNKNNIGDTNGNIGNKSSDDIFNKKVDVDAGNAMFYQDDYFDASWSPYPQDFGIGPELSRKSFVIYDKKLFQQYDFNLRWTDYLSGLQKIYINPYTGTIIEG